jgi:SPP1 gp7 family putative phage head morphogenesis protein
MAVLSLRNAANRLAAKDADRKQFDSLMDKGTRLFITDMLDLAEFIAGRVLKFEMNFDIELVKSDEYQKLLTDIQQTMILSDMTARDQVLRWTEEAIKKGGDFAGITSVSPFVPEIRFEDAIDDYIKRRPKLAIGYLEVQRVYNIPGGAPFAAARSASEKLTERVQREIVRSIEEGEPADEVVKRIQENAREEFHDWSRAYAETVYRTNMATAYQAGEFRELQDPAVAEVIVGLEFSAVGDSDTRPEHAALDGMIAATTDPIWNPHSPPIGYNCRCSTIRVDRFDAEARGLLSPAGTLNQSLPDGFTGEPPDSGFRNIRPDRQVYG